MRGVTMAYSYRCGDYPGNEARKASFVAQTEKELWKHIEVHGAIAHQEDLRSGPPRIGSRCKS
jgi:hypothetical protein